MFSILQFLHIAFFPWIYKWLLFAQKGQEIFVKPIKITLDDDKAYCWSIYCEFLQILHTATHVTADRKLASDAKWTRLVRAPHCSSDGQNIHYTDDSVGFNLIIIHGMSTSCHILIYSPGSFSQKIYVRWSILSGVGLCAGWHRLKWLLCSQIMMYWYWGKAGMVLSVRKKSEAWC